MNNEQKKNPISKCKTYKPSTFDLLPEDVKEKGKQIIRENRNTNFELCYILKVDPEIYESVEISKVDFSARVRTALSKFWTCPVFDGGLKNYHYVQHDGCKTVADILHLTVREMERIRNLGITGQAETLIMTKKFIDEERNFDVQLSNVYDNADIRPRRLGYSLNCLMHGRDYTNISYNKTEKIFIEKYKSAIELLDFELCTAAFNGNKAIYDIIRALYIFSEPKIRYCTFINKIDKKIRDMPEPIKYKSVKQLVTKYCKKNKRIQADFLLNLDESVRLIDLPNNIPKSEMGNRNTIFVLSNFLDWLDLDTVKHIII